MIRVSDAGWLAPNPTCLKMHSHLLGRYRQGILEAVANARVGDDDVQAPHRPLYLPHGGVVVCPVRGHELDDVDATRMRLRQCVQLVGAIRVSSTSKDDGV